LCLHVLYFIFSAENWFPYLKRRIPVIDTQVEEKSPIEVAVAEMESQVAELTEIVNAKAPDIKRLQLRYSSLSTVNGTSDYIL
jgi:hypothetical protein